MINSKLIQLLRGLSNTELRELELFVQSPFHNKNKTISKLYKILVRYAPDFNHAYLEKKQVADRLFSGVEKEKIKKLQYAMSSFVKLLDDYLINKELQTEKEDKQFLLLKAYKKRALDKFFFKSAQDFDKRLDGLPYRDIEYFNLKHQLNKAILTHPTTEKVSKTVNSFQETFEYLDFYYLSSKFLQSIVAHDRRHTFGEEYSFFLKKELLEISEQEKWQKIPLFRIYNFLIQDTVKENLEEKVSIYYQLKDEVLNSLSLFREPYREDLVICILNFATRLHRLGLQDFDREVFEFYKLLLKDYYSSKKDQLQSSVFINAVILACELEEITWAEQFISEGVNLLDVQEKIPMEALGRAYVACGKKAYDEALVHLRDLEYPNIYYVCLAKFLSTRCFYEMEEEDLLFTFLKTFENFIRRHTQLSENRKKPILNFIKFTRKLYTNRYHEKYTQQQLFEQLEKQESTSYNSWLRSKIEETSHS